MRYGTMGRMRYGKVRFDTMSTVRYAAVRRNGAVLFGEYGVIRYG